MKMNRKHYTALALVLGMTASVPSSGLAFVKGAIKGVTKFGEQAASHVGGAMDKLKVGAQKQFERLKSAAKNPWKKDFDPGINSINTSFYSEGSSISNPVQNFSQTAKQYAQQVGQWSKGKLEKAQEFAKQGLQDTKIWVKENPFTTGAMAGALAMSGIDAGMDAAISSARK